MTAPTHSQPVALPEPPGRTGRAPALLVWAAVLIGWMALSAFASAAIVSYALRRE